MSIFTSHTMETAPENAKDELQKTVDKYGVVLPIFADMAESPLPVHLYNYGQTLLMEQGTLSNEEVNLAQLAVSIVNECQFCVAAHSMAARGHDAISDAVINAVRAGQDVPDDKLGALVNLTQAIALKRGQLGDADFQAFLDAGYTKAQIFELLCIASYKTITNYTSQFAGTQPHGPLQVEAWTPADLKKAA